jgi:large subunit ribosomal protein L23
VTDLNNQYVFKVAIDSTKAEIKKSVEQLFSVKVSTVNTLKVKGKVKRNRYGMSAKSTWKKAYVRLEQGQEIDFAVAE